MSRNEPLAEFDQTAIRLETLVTKLTFLERRPDEVELRSSDQATMVGRDRLKNAMIYYSGSLTSRGFKAPPAELFEKWLDGRPAKLRDVDFLGLFFEYRYEKMYSTFHPEQKKVYNQVANFLSTDEQQRSATEDQFGNMSPVAPPFPRPTRSVVQLSLIGLQDHIKEAKERLNDDHPNSEEASLAKESSLALIELFEGEVDNLQAALERSMITENSQINDTDVRLLDAVSNEFRKWLIANNPELVDAAMRLTPAATFISVLSLAGANMAWATPIVLAMCGGKKIVEILKDLKP